MRCSILSASALALAVAASGALAADLTPITKAPQPVPYVTGDWTGFYLGLHGGYAWGETSVDAPFSATGVTLTPLFANPSPKGGLFGGQFGYNWQHGLIVGGLEVDISGADITESVSTSLPVGRNATLTIGRDVKLDELASARGRFGYLLFPDLMLYGTAGIGWGHTEATVSASACAATCVAASESANANVFGWVAGAGLEYKILSNWLLGIEYLHYDFARATYNFPVPIVGVDTNARTEVDALRLRGSYKF